MRILKIYSLPTKSEYWIDNDEIMLHSCFQLLKDFVEKENGDNQQNYDYYKDFVDEVRFLYNWWICRSQKNIFDDEKQNEEDDNMLIRLIKIRKNLWT